jgi:hypothetical protein
MLHHVPRKRTILTICEEENVLEWIKLLFSKKYISCDKSNGTDYSVETKYKKLNGKIYIVSSTVIPNNVINPTSKCSVDSLAGYQPSATILTRTKPEEIENDM